MVPRALKPQAQSNAGATADRQKLRPEPARTLKVSSFFRWKRAIDLPLAVVLLIPFGPVMGLLWVLVKVGSSGPGFYRQDRLGRGGQTFTMIKLRSMRQDAESVTGAIWSTTDDPRTTRLGRVLRTYHLDELPQLFNVIKGEMSLVGPRPERPEFVEVLEEKISDYRHRLMVPPGITGLAQLNLPPDIDLNSVRRKLVLDLEYVEQGDLWIEVRLLVCTAARLVKLPTISLLGLHRNPVLTPSVKACSCSSSIADTTPISSLLEQTHRDHSNGNGHANGARSQSSHERRTTLPHKPK